MHRLLFAAVVTLSAGSALAAAFPSPPLYPSFTAPKPAITTFDVPGASSTIPTGINTKGEIAGNYVDANSIVHGFIRRANGNIETFDEPNVDKTSGGTLVTAINTRGDIIGIYADKTGAQQGFLRTAGGKFVELTAPKFSSLEPTGINSDEITGIAENPGSGTEQAFVRDATGNVTLFSVNGKNTIPEYIGADGTIIGEFEGTSGARAFLRTPHGKIVKIDVPNAEDTFAVAINKKDLIVGYFFDANQVIHGYVRATDGTLTTFDVPATQGTAILGVDQFGNVLGGYLDSNNKAHGFLRTLAGKIDKFAVVTGGKTRPTVAKSINDAGAIVGAYLDGRGASQAEHGFIRAP